MKVRLKRVPINAGGYDSFGRYYGVGAPLWRAESDTEVDATVARGGWTAHTFTSAAGTHVDTEFRAFSRDEAKDKILSFFPDAKFYR